MKSAETHRVAIVGAGFAGSLTRGLARTGPVGHGFDAGADGSLIGADGRPSGAIYTLGPPLKGMYWETTAVPEIRAQALASRLVGATLGDLPR